MSLLSKRTRDDPRRDATIQAFLKATLSLLEEGESFANLNVSRISERARRTRTAFYAHFEDRRALLMILFEDAAAEALTTIHPFQHGLHAHIDEDVRKSVEGLFSAFGSHAVLLKAVVEAAGYDNDIAKLWGQIVGHFIQGTQERLLREGIAPNLAASTAATLVWMTERTCYQQAVLRSTDLDDAAMTESIARVWISTLRQLGL